MKTAVNFRKIMLSATRWTLPAGLALAIVAARTSGQQNPQPRPEGDPGRDAGMQEPRPDEHENRGGPEMGHRFGGRMGEMNESAGRRGGNGPGWAPTLMPPQMQQVERMRGYLDLVDKFFALARDPSESGVAAVITAGDLLRARGNEAAINFYTEILPKVSDPVVQRAIHVQLAEMYRSAGKADDAMSELAALMTGKPETITLPPTTKPSK